MPFDPASFVIIQNFHAAQAFMREAISLSEPDGDAAKAANQHMALASFDYAVGITHRITTTLASAHTIEMSDSQGEIYLNALTNPVTGDNTVNYAITEHDRGGDHAFYARTAEERGGVILQDGAAEFSRAYARGL